MILVTEKKCIPIWETVTGYILDKKERDIDICVYHLHRALFRSVCLQCTLQQRAGKTKTLQLIET